MEEINERASKEQKVCRRQGEIASTKARKAYRSAILSIDSLKFYHN
jgi:hypothetical protein